LQLPGEQPARNLGQDTRTIAALSISRNGAPVAEVGNRLDGLSDDVVPWLAAQSRDKADAAGVVLEPRVV